MAAGDPLIGKKLGDYTIQGLLGQGGMSRVYVGYDENLDRYAAVKVISGELATMDETEYARRFQTEARAIARLRHPNIVGIYQFGRSEGIYYMAQVLLEGTDLRTLLREYAGRGEYLPPDTIIRITRDIASALDYAHEHGVIHRDIKPSNIMLERRSGRAILMDFGLALNVPEGTPGDTFGSAHYIAPEQAVSSAKAVPQSDLYSLGVVVYEMATGTVPFDDPSVMSVALKHVSDPPPAPTLYNPDLPPAVEQVILRALAKEPAERYHTGAEFVAALERAYTGMPPEQEPDSQPARPSHPAPAPTPKTAEPVTESRLTGLAARFARRRRQKQDEEALRTLADGTLGLDGSDLDALLNSYADPRELGLTGPDAPAVSAAAIRAALDSTPSAPEKSRSRRRTRVRLLLVLLILVALGAAAVIMGTRDTDDQTASGGPTGLASSNTRDVTPTDDVTRTTPTAQATTTDLTADAQAARSATPADDEAIAIAPTGTPEATPTRVPTATPTTAPTVTETPIEIPSPTRTATPEPTSTLPPTITTTPLQPGKEPNIRLIYNADEFLLVNISGETLDISRLVFEQSLGDGATRLFQATLWDREGIIDPPARMRPGGCFQLVTSTTLQMPPESAVCPVFLGYFRSIIDDRIFWIADDPAAVFTVRTAPDAEPLATCAIAAGQCDIYTDIARIPPTPTPGPTATPTALPPAPDILLAYNASDVLLVNISGRTLDISGLVFEQALPDGGVRRFEAAQWDRPDLLASPAQMEPGTCYQLVTAEGVRTPPDRTVCARFLGWFRTGVASRYFWIADTPGAVFTVREADAETPLAECMIDAGTCLFRLE